MRRVVVRCVSSIDDSSGIGQSAAYDQLRAVAFDDGFALLIGWILLHAFILSTTRTASFISAPSAARFCCIRTRLRDAG